LRNLGSFLLGPIGGLKELSFGSFSFGISFWVIRTGGCTPAGKSLTLSGKIASFFVEGSGSFRDAGLIKSGLLRKEGLMLRKKKEPLILDRKKGAPISFLAERISFTINVIREGKGRASSASRGNIAYSEETRSRGKGVEREGAQVIPLREWKLCSSGGEGAVFLCFQGGSPTRLGLV